jgi:hypothetical protein
MSAGSAAILRFTSSRSVVSSLVMPGILPLPVARLLATFGRFGLLWRRERSTRGGDWGQGGVYLAPFHWHD